MKLTKHHSIDELLSLIGEHLAQQGQQAEHQDQLSVENYDLLKSHKVFSAMVPQELGGGGVSYGQMCQFLTSMAHYHPSTALAVSMHQHIIAANRFNYLHGKPGQALLQKVSTSELVLISTGAGDWLASNGEMQKVQGGYHFTATKHFASGSTVGNVFVTSGAYEDPEHGWQVLHFPVPVKSEGVTILDNWQPMGMRGTGSNSVQMDKVFIPEEAVAVRRPRGDYHMMWNVVLPVALPIIMSVYRGIAQKAAGLARHRCANSTDPGTPYLLGEMGNALTIVELAVADMIRLCEEFRFTPSLPLTNEMLKRKTIASNACKEVAEKAMVACGGPGYLRQFGIEALLRDSYGAQFHPMQEKRQHYFSGLLALGKTPPPQAF